MLLQLPEPVVATLFGPLARHPSLGQDSCLVAAILAEHGLACWHPYNCKASRAGSANGAVTGRAAGRSVADMHQHLLRAWKRGQARALSCNKS